MKRSTVSESISHAHTVSLKLTIKTFYCSSSVQISSWPPGGFNVEDKNHDKDRILNFVSIEHFFMASAHVQCCVGWSGWPLGYLVAQNLYPLAK